MRAHEDETDTGKPVSELHLPPWLNRAIAEVQGEQVEDPWGMVPYKKIQRLMGRGVRRG